MTEITLSSGKKAVIRKGMAQDFVNAQMMIKKPEEIPLALIAVLVEVDGKRMTLEEVRRMDIEDYIQIIPSLGIATKDLDELFSK